MAQITPKSRWFEQHWRPRLGLAAKVLRDYQDTWLRSDRPFPVREAVAVLLNVFAFDFHSAEFVGYRGLRAEELWSRSPEDWPAAVGSPESECARLCPNRSPAECRDLVASLCAEVARVVESWERHGPSQPAGEQLVQSLLEQLVAGSFVNIRYG